MVDSKWAAAAMAWKGAGSHGNMKLVIFIILCISTYIYILYIYIEYIYIELYILNYIYIEVISVLNPKTNWRDIKLDHTRPFKTSNAG